MFPLPTIAFVSVEDTSCQKTFIASCPLLDVAVIVDDEYRMLGPKIQQLSEFLVRLISDSVSGCGIIRMRDTHCDCMIARN
jgi:hypothetical protein